VNVAKDCYSIIAFGRLLWVSSSLSASYQPSGRFRVHSGHRIELCNKPFAVSTCFSGTMSGIAAAIDEILSPLIMSPITMIFLREK